MPSDTHAQGSAGESALPVDTMGILARNANGGDAGSTRAASSADTILGKAVVEQGLASEEDVVAAARKKGTTEDANQKTLASILVEEGIVTERQIARLKGYVDEVRSGQRIPGYTIMGKLGAGAMATVFKARQLSLDRLVAIKILPRKFSTNKQFIDRFYAEGRAAAQLNHPNIVQAFDVGQAGEFHYFVMEFVDGVTVHDAIVANKRFNETEALDIAIAVTEALQHAHAKGLIHRDIKPKNIMITPQGVVKVADLGLARAIDDKEAALAEAGKAYGTPYYISPEQIRGEVNVNAQADIYSLGATLYHMVTGNVPYNGKNPSEVMQKHLKTELVPPDHINPKLSSGISEIIEMMMAKSRKDRYKNCTDLLTDLRAIQRKEQPPIAHKDIAPTVDVAELVRLESAKATAIPVDTSAPKVDPRVKRLTALLVGVSAFALVMVLVSVLLIISNSK
ncbi:MAG TPA: serine/threonine-protein kinase [Phycisphaerales bacterium]|nr:serine/threonine-protein kinase [Phycisphaerales bacterium]